ncbi:MAG: PEP/pyruvate-binding domain-containing protein [Candidatus Promineifilaceae bacterium]
MANELVLPLNDLRANLETVGGKGASLARMINAGLPVPAGFHITTEAYRRFVAENDLQAKIDEALGQIDLEKPATLQEASTQIRQAFLAAPIPQDSAAAIVGAYGDLSGTNPAVAVRSSATAEDLPEASFAGQQESYLNVSGAEDVLEATRKCWSSLWTARAIGYRARQNFDSEEVALAVVVQELVPAEVAGILFTVDPIYGNRSQVQVSAAWGLGDAVVGGRVTPDDYLVDKETGRVLRQLIADKEVMTVRVSERHGVDGTTVDQPVPQNLRSVPVLQREDLKELARLGVEIEALYGRPMDVEWTLADGNFAIVQARPITALPEAAVPPGPRLRGDQWELPDPKDRFMRTSIVDFMPDPLSPLFSTMGLSAYNRGLVQMMLEVMKKDKTSFPDDTLVTINDYAYMRVNFSAKAWWDMLSRLAPRLITLIRNGPDHFREVALPEYREKINKLNKKDVTGMTAVEIWRDAHELIYEAVYFLSILQVDTLGASAGSEGLFTAIYNRFYHQNGYPQASTYLMGYNTTPIRSEKSLYDLAAWTHDQPALVEYFLETDAKRIAAAFSEMEPPDGITPGVWADWWLRFDTHQKTYGHILYDLDFARPIPAEDPAPAIELIKMYMRGEGANPHERQDRLENEREQAREELLQRARGPRGWAVRKALGWATSLAEVREDSIASIGLAYPRLRELLHELGRRLAEAGATAAAEDVYWLEEAEIEERLRALEKGEPLASMAGPVEERKQLRQAEQKVMPPAQLPYSKTYLGIPIEAFVPGEGGQEAGRLKGVGASGGRVTGAACVLHGPQDFDQMEQGGILVAKLTTPAWTPLFAMAGGVVTDIGGPLSHGSIVSREYGIPAVMGTTAATRVIQSGQTITVDGDNGYVYLGE